MSIFDIKKRRNELNLTLEQIGNYVGVSKSTVKKWETGYIDNMKRDKIALLAEVLQVSPLCILGIDSDYTVEQSSNIVLDKYEKSLITNYRTLSDQGKEYILQTMNMAVNTYKKDNRSSDNTEQIS